MRVRKIWILLLTLGMICAVSGCSARGREDGREQTDSLQKDSIQEESMQEEHAGGQEESAADQESLKQPAGSEAAGRTGQDGQPEEEGAVPETDETEDPVILVLDPGHDDKECCTNSHPDLNMYEQELNLAIGLACRDRLQEYEGIKVYMTREDGTCPDREFGGDECIRARTDFSARVDADLFVSLHCNGSTGVYGAEANGCEVYVSNYSAFTEDCTRLGEMIIKNLGELDIADGGVRVRTKEEKGYYDDGSVKDWYYLISNNADAGYPAIIIEHAYMDNAHDNAILLEEENLKAMGRADADAIAQYFGLSLKK